MEHQGWQIVLAVWLAAQLPLGLLLGTVMGAGRDADERPEARLPEPTPHLG